MILYHGSPESEIEQLEARIPDPDSEKMTERLQAVFLSDDPLYASNYRGPKGTVYEVELADDAVRYRIPDNLEDEDFRDHLEEAIDLNAEVIIFTGRTSGIFLDVVGTEFAVLDENLLKIKGRWDWRE